MPVIAGNPVDGYFGPFNDTQVAFTWASDRNLDSFYVGELRPPEAFVQKTQMPPQSDAKPPPAELTDAEFNRMLAGPLAHPMPMFVITRLSLALRCVVEEMGGEAAEVLRAYCQGREERDSSDPG